MIRPWDLGSHWAVTPSQTSFVTARLGSNEDLGGGCRLLALVLPEQLPAWDVEPGQFVMLRGDWGLHPLLPRAFSVLSAGSGRLEILVKVVGRGTRLLAGQAPGSTMTVLGPLGRPFPAPASGVKDLLVAGGSGIGPLFFYGLRAAPGSDLELLYGGRSGGDLVLAARAAAAGLRLHLCTEDGSAGSRGMVTDLLGERLDGSGPMRVLACGPTPMLRAVVELCGARGVECWVSLETEMACGVGLCRGCSVAHPEGGWRCTCLDGAVFRAEEVLL